MAAWPLWLAAAALLAWSLRRSLRRQAAQRLGSLGDCAGLLGAARLADAGSDYPCLHGRYRGVQVEVQPLLDHVGFRKRPSLWLLVTLASPLPTRGSLDVLLRPQNIEFYAAGDVLAQRIELPGDWPAHHLARVSPAGWQPPLAALRGAVADLLDTQELKELLVTPRGLRLVVRAGGVERAAYLVLRSLLPEQARVPRALLERALEAALRVRAVIADAPQPA